MSDQVQIMRRIGACENKQAQPDWSGPEIPACTEPAAFLCEVCGHMLCGNHAGGHYHPASNASAIASHFQEEAAQAQQSEAAAKANAEALAEQLKSAEAQLAKLAKIQALLSA